MAQTGTRGWSIRIWFLSLSVVAVACADTRVGANDGGRASATDAATNCMREPKKHRPQAEPCDHERSPSADSGGAGCLDSVCTDGVNGRCGVVGFRSGMCTYDECFADAECQGGCVCAASATDNNRCFGGNCRTDSDCGAAGYCSPSSGTCSNLEPTYHYCHTCEDECVDDTDCAAGRCQYAPTIGHWMCVNSQCVG